jgi:hypothetical protein
MLLVVQRRAARTKAAAESMIPTVIMPMVTVPQALGARDLSA